MHSVGCQNYISLQGMSGIKLAS